MKKNISALRADARRRARASLRDMTDEEEAAINRGIAADPDNPELTDEWFARARPVTAAEARRFRAAFKRGRGRPLSERKKISVTIRVDPDVLAALKAQGPGWQTRVNELLVRWVKRQRRAA
jgi:uncharacterized protein (DUF4415 family)